MMSKIKSLLSGTKAKIMAFSMAVAGGLLAGSNVFAEVDPAVASTTSMVVDTMKENVVGVITINIANIVIVGVIIFSIGFIWKLSRKFMK
jgi:hypothetical protein